MRQHVIVVMRGRIYVKPTNSDDRDEARMEGLGMKTITKTEWARMHTDDKKMENGNHMVLSPIIEEVNGKHYLRGSEWKQVKIK